MESIALDAAGHRRSPATMPGDHHGRPPRSEGFRYPADPPTIEETVAVMRAVGERPDGLRPSRTDRAPRFLQRTPLSRCVATPCRRERKRALDRPALEA
jgi:hypothetical protein